MRRCRHRFGAADNGLMGGEVRAAAGRLANFGGSAPGQRGASHIRGKRRMQRPTAMGSILVCNDHSPLAI